MLGGRDKEITASDLILLLEENKLTIITKDNNNNKRITTQAMRRCGEDPAT